MIDVSKKGKGALVRGEDPRDVPYSSLIFGAPVVNWDKGFDVEENLGIKVRIDDQGSSQSCVAQAWSKYGEVVDYVETRQIPDLSARDIYSRIFVPPDGVAYGYKGGSVLKDRGVAEEKFILSYISGNPPDEAFMRIRNDDPDVAKNAAIRKIKGYAFVSGSNVDELAHAIQNNHGALFGVTGSNNGWQTGHPRPPLQGEPVWGHFLYASGFKIINGRKYVYGPNSWGKAWGQGGYYFLEESYFAQGWTFNGMTLADLPNNVQDQIKMKDLIKIGESPEQYVVESGKRFRIPDLETKAYLRDQLKIILDEPRVITKEEFDRFYDGGIIPSFKLHLRLGSIYTDFRDAFEEGQG